MKKVISIVFSRFTFDEPNERILSAIKDCFSKYKYSDESGFGFKEIEIFDDHLEATLLKRTSTYIQDYDSESNQLVRKQIFLFSSIHFSIDTQMNLLIVEGGMAHLNIIKSIFRNVLSFKYSLIPIDYSLPSLVFNLKEKNYPVNIKQAIVKNFKYENGIIGRFSGEVINQNIGNMIIEEYKSDILKITISIDITSDETYLLQIFPNGNIKFLSEHSEYSYIINYLKTVIFN